jgi:hypothetical protein
MRGRRGQLSATGWVVLLGCLIAVGLVVHDLMTHPLSLTARVEAYRDGQHALLVGTSIVHAPSVVRTFPTGERCEAQRHEALQEARAAGHPLPSLTCLATLPRWAGALVSLLPARRRTQGAFFLMGTLAHQQ